MTPEQRIFESVYNMTEMARATAAHMDDFVKSDPDILATYRDPEHVKAGTAANEKWHKYINDYFDLFPEDDVDPEGQKPKTRGKAFSDAIFNSNKHALKADNAGKSEKTMSTEGIIADLKKIQDKMEAAGLADTGAYESVAMALESLAVVLDDSTTKDIEALDAKEE